MSNSLIARLIERVRMRLWLRDEYENTALRRHFASNYSVEVGLYSYGCFDRWRVPPRTRIGRYCSFAKSARILDANHPLESLSTHPYFYEAKWGVVEKDRIDAAWLLIEDDVWIGHNAVITPGCKHIGRGAIIGTGAIVTRNVPPYAVMVGLPAKKLRDRFDPATIAALEASHWWEMSKAELKALAAKNPDLVFQPSAQNLAQSLLQPGR
jgi:acetyltransferase-like isoleucine patch superfamily enzyme